MLNICGGFVNTGFKLHFPEYETCTNAENTRLLK